MSHFSLILCRWRNVEPLLLKSCRWSKVDPLLFNSVPLELGVSTSLLFCAAVARLIHFSLIMCRWSKVDPLLFNSVPLELG